MTCPHCGAWTEVKETRGVRRRRECGNGHRFTTIEQVVNDKTKMQVLRRQPVSLEKR